MAEIAQQKILLVRLFHAEEQEIGEDGLRLVVTRAHQPSTPVEDVMFLILHGRPQGGQSVHRGVDSGGLVDVELQ